MRKFDAVNYWIYSHSPVLFFVALLSAVIFAFYVGITNQMKCIETCGLDNIVRECNFTSVTCEPRPKDNLLRFHLK